MGLETDLAVIRTMVEGFMPDRLTNSRTTATVAVRVTAETTLERLQGLPPQYRMPRWELKVPDGTDITAGDECTVPDRGTYTVLFVDDPASYTVQIVCHAARTRTDTGVPCLPTNSTVTFRNPRGIGAGADPFTAPVFLMENSHDLERFPEAAGYEYSVFYDPALDVRGGWEMTWTDILGDTHTELLTPPTRLTEFLPIVCSYVKTR